MLSMKVPSMTDAYYEMKSCSTSLAFDIEELSNIKATLNTLSGMDAITNRIQKVIGKAENERQAALQLMRGLDTACQYYSACENRILSNCEDSIIRNKPLAFGVFNLSNIAQNLSDITIQ